MAISAPFLVLSVLFLGVALAEVVEKRKVYIVYLGETQHEDPELTEKLHDDMLAKVVGSKELASELMVHKYKHGFSGFAAKLTKGEAHKIAEQPDVVHVTPDTIYKLQTTRSWENLGLSSPMPNNLLGKGNQGDGIIIGVIDSGISPESKSFSDEGLGPIPSRWKGVCVSGEDFNATHCNRKIIGAHYFMDGHLAEQKAAGDFNMTLFREFNAVSPRDVNGHGTHVASTAAGSYVGNASYQGLGAGTLRGGAPKARIAVYKVCWNQYSYEQLDCSQADIAKAIDQATHDGVDIMQLSIGSLNWGTLTIDTVGNKPPLYALHAVKKGITVVYAAGNEGPEPNVIANVDPWAITVGASSMDRQLLAPITLGDPTIGNKKNFYGHGLSTVFPDTGFRELVAAQSCDAFLNDTTETIGGKVILCFRRDINDKSAQSGIFNAINAKAAGVIVAKTATDDLEADKYNAPYFEVDLDVGNLIMKYAYYTSLLNKTATIRLSPTKSVEGPKYGLPKVAAFSSRGPNSDVPEILKPDIIAPGVNILAAVAPEFGLGDAYAFMSGTSMAAPHVSGILALLKEVHPDWSPAAMKSALMTTAWNTNRHGLPIFAEGHTKKVADAFDMGAGIVNPNGAMNPGLVYDMDMNDYTHYFCAYGSDNAIVFKVIKKSCPEKTPSMLDFNLPSITIPSLRNSTTLTRTVTNVGGRNSVYKAVIEAPRGTVISVRPNVLVFNAKKKKISFKVNVYSTYQVRSEYYNFGSLTWTDGVHAVRSPISVKTDVELPF